MGRGTRVSLLGFRCNNYTCFSKACNIRGGRLTLDVYLCHPVGKAQASELAWLKLGRVRSSSSQQRGAASFMHLLSTGGLLKLVPQGTSSCPYCWIDQGSYLGMTLRLSTSPRSCASRSSSKRGTYMVSIACNRPDLKAIICKRLFYLHQDLKRIQPIFQRTLIIRLLTELHTISCAPCLCRRAFWLCSPTGTL